MKISDSVNIWLDCIVDIVPCRFALLVWMHINIAQSWLIGTAHSI